LQFRKVSSRTSINSLGIQMEERASAEDRQQNRKSRVSRYIRMPLCSDSRSVFSLDSSSSVVITVRPFHGLWEAFELPGVQPLFSTRERATVAARAMLKGRAGLIEVLDANESVIQTIDT